MGYSIFDDTIADMSWPEVEQAVKAGVIALLPTGVIEAHGPHMSLGVDAYGSYIRCRLLKKELEARGINSLIVPPYYWGINNALGSFYGSFTVRKETMVSLLYDVLASLKSWGVDKVFNINHHGDPEHCGAIFEAIKSSRNALGIEAYCVISKGEAERFGFAGSEDFIALLQEDEEEAAQEYVDIHAGAWETSMMLEYFPGEVDEEMAKTLKPTNMTFSDMKEWRKGWEVSRRVTPLGYVGDPAGYCKAEGKQDSFALAAADIIEVIVKNGV